MVDGTTDGLGAAEVLLTGIPALVVDAGLVARAVRAEHALWVTTGDIAGIAQHSGQAAANCLAVDVLADGVGSADVGQARVRRWLRFCECLLIAVSNKIK